MNTPLDIVVIALGVQGLRMLDRIAEHGGLRVAAAWDPDAARIAAARERHPSLAIAASSGELLETAGVRGAYIASPPASHMEHARRAFDAGLAVFCEKPLAVDFEEARRVIERIEREGLKAAVNFSLASSPGLAAIETAVREKRLGEIRRVEIQCAFKEWPRPWQSAAGAWLAQRGEGGFTREVLSHFVFVLQRVFGKATVVHARTTYPADGVGAETALEAQLRVQGIPVDVEGRVGGEAADANRFALIGDQGTLELANWLSLPQAPARAPYLRQLDQLAAFIGGRSHALPGFAEALAVQETIEAMLGGANAA